MIGAAEERKDVSSRRLRVGGDDARNLMSAGGNLDVPRLRELVEQLAIDVRHQVAESIDPQDFAHERVAACLRHRNHQLLDIAGWPAERREIDALADPSRGRCEAVASFKGFAHRGPSVTPFGELDDTLRRRFL